MQFPVGWNSRGELVGGTRVGLAHLPALVGPARQIDKMCPYVLRPKRYAHAPEFDGAKGVIPDAEYFWDR